VQKWGWFLIDSDKVQGQKSGVNLLRTKPVKRFPMAIEQCSLEQLDGRSETALHLFTRTVDLSFLLDQTGAAIAW